MPVNMFWIVMNERQKIPNLSFGLCCLVYPAFSFEIKNHHVGNYIYIYIFICIFWSYWCFALFLCWKWIRIKFSSLKCMDTVVQFSFQIKCELAGCLFQIIGVIWWKMKEDCVTKTSFIFYGEYVGTTISCSDVFISVVFGRVVCCGLLLFECWTPTTVGASSRP